MGGQSSHLPLKINMSGVIPPIFASSIMMFPSTIAAFVDVPWVPGVCFDDDAGPLALQSIFFVAFIIFFCYFYYGCDFQSGRCGRERQKSTAAISRCTSRQANCEYLDTVLGRLTFAGAIYIAAICVLRQC